MKTFSLPCKYMMPYEPTIPLHTCAILSMESIAKGHDTETEVISGQGGVLCSYSAYLLGDTISNALSLTDVKDTCPLGYTFDEIVAKVETMEGKEADWKKYLR